MVTVHLKKLSASIFRDVQGEKMEAANFPETLVTS
jgi:hypothetical protein